MLLQIQDGTLSIGAQTVLAHFDFEIRIFCDALSPNTTRIND